MCKNNNKKRYTLHPRSKSYNANMRQKKYNQHSLDCLTGLKFNLYCYCFF